MTTPTPLLSVRVRATTWEAEGVLGFELVPLPPATALPAFTAGAHIDLHLPGGLTRSYSLLNDPRETHRYCIAVHRAPESRGGSRHLHEVLRTGAVIEVSSPRNHFPLDEAASFNVFIAGGIGITPLLSMIERSHALGTPWRLHYAARTHAHAAFAGRLQTLVQAGGGEVQLNFDHEPGGRRLDLQSLVAALPDGAHVYCCGPLPMLESFEQAVADLPPKRAHREYFAATHAPDTAGGFEVVLERSGKTLAIAPGQTILDGLIDAGCEPPWSCREGVCGTCEVRVLDGTPDHRDLVLTDAEKATGDRMMVCCSGARSARLVLDL